MSQITRDDLRAAVGAGLMTEAQAASVITLAEERDGLRARRSGLDEPFELFKGFNEVFIVVGLTILYLGWSGITGFSLLASTNGWILGMVFGVVAIGFGLAAVLNGRLVERFGIPSMIAGAVMFAIVGSALLVAISLSADGNPNFWLFMALTGVTLSSFMLLMPNMNTAAMTPLGHIAGVASAFTSAIRIGVGSAIAGVLINLIDDTVLPFAISLLATVLACATTVVIIRRLPGGQSTSGLAD